MIRLAALLAAVATPLAAQDGGSSLPTFPMGDTAPEAAAPVRPGVIERPQVTVRRGGVINVTPRDLWGKKPKPRPERALAAAGPAIDDVVGAINPTEETDVLSGGLAAIAAAPEAPEGGRLTLRAPVRPERGNSDLESVVELPAPPEEAPVAETLEARAAPLPAIRPLERPTDRVQAEVQAQQEVAQNLDTGTGLIRNLPVMDMDEVIESRIVVETIELGAAEEIQLRPRQAPVQAVDGAAGAVLRGLDKVSGEVRDLDLAVGETAQLGRLSVSLGECRYPAQNPAGDAYAWVEIEAEGRSDPAFQGWMVASSPALSALDHPRYDVWVIRCRS